MLIAVLQAFAGLVLLVLAGDILVRGSAALAETLGLSPLLVGLTIVAFGTSAPELFVGVDAVLRGAPTLALGNVVGSNIANTLLVVGLPAMIAPLSCATPRLNRTMAVMIGASVLFIALSTGGSISFFEGLILFSGLVLFLIRSGYQAKRDPQAAKEILEFEEDIDSTKDRPGLAVLFVVGGCLGLVFGADFLVTGSVHIATALGVSEAVIGLTLVALGTSLPELATGIAAAFRSHSEVALGNIIGSNIFNLLGIMGITAMVGAVPVPPSFFAVDLWVMLGTAFLILPFTIRRAQIGRGMGVLFVIGYAAYVLWLAFYGGSLDHMGSSAL